jgi:hypothetical protein
MVQAVHEAAFHLDHHLKAIHVGCGGIVVAQRGLEDVAGLSAVKHHTGKRIRGEYDGHGPLC